MYTKLDLTEAYLPLDEASQKLVVISRHIGLFMYTRLPYGVSTGPGSFQRKITALLLGIPGVVVVIDDIIITADTMSEHIRRVKEMLRRLNEAGVRLHFKKCKFLPSEVVYLGYRLNKHGIHPVEEKI